MGIRDAIAALVGRNPIYPNVTYGNNELAASVMGMPVEQLWRTQPYLRTIVTFLARNIAQLGLHSFQRVSDTDRQRLRDDALPRLLATPNPQMTTYELVFSLVADLALYDEAFWIVAPDVKSVSGWTIQPLSPSWITARGGGSVFAAAWLEFSAPGTGRIVRVQMDDVIWFHGWNPGSPATASSPVEALKQILAEQISAQAFRQQVWAKGGRIGGVLTRPVGAKWDSKVREKFQRQWQAKYAGNDGAQAGGTPILEDGMTYNRVGFNAHEEEYVEGSKLSFSTVASVYHVNPTMVGILDNANFSNVREFRKMLYGDTLGSTISMIEDRVNTFLVPKVTATPDVYVEFNIAEKLQGSFEEQAAALSSSTGRPWMTANEARAKNNMPALGGDADQLVTPLNVLVGGQASPLDSGSQNEKPKSLGELVQVKSVTFKSGDGPETYQEKAAQVLAAFFKRQSATVLSALGVKAAQEWWDQARWDKELSDDLYKLAATTATDLGQAQAVAMGFQPGDYDEARTLKFLRAVADSRAGMVNATTRDRVQKALDDSTDPADVFDEAQNVRSMSGGKALVAALAGFALVEAARQTVGTKATKTWLAGPNPRSAHAAMNGETVAVEDVFSNGADWPGDPVLGAAGVANCNCRISIQY